MRSETALGCYRSRPTAGMQAMALPLRFSAASDACRWAEKKGDT